APACAAVRRHRARGRGSQVGPVRDQASRYQAGTRQSFHRGGRWRKTGNGPVRRAPAFIWRSAGIERGWTLRWAVSLGESLWLLLGGHGGARFFSGIHGELTH